MKTPIFYSASGRFARITRISDSRESGDSRESRESIRANHATKGQKIQENMYFLTYSWPMLPPSPGTYFWPIFLTYFNYFRVSGPLGRPQFHKSRRRNLNANFISQTFRAPPGSPGKIPGYPANYHGPKARKRWSANRELRGSRRRGCRDGCQDQPEKKKTIKLWIGGKKGAQTVN